MKRFMLLSLFPLFLSAPALWAEENYPPDGWMTNITQAVAAAEKEEKKILLAFLGSDWCEWCHKLENEVWKTQEFQDYARENLILVYLDFPQGITLEAEQQNHNFILQQMLGVKGYPTVWLLDSHLTPLLKTGYQEGGPQKYKEHLENDILQIPQEDAEKFRLGFRQGIEEYIGPLPVAAN